MTRLNLQLSSHSNIAEKISNANNSIEDLKNKKMNLEESLNINLFQFQKMENLIRMKSINLKIL